MVIYDCPMVHFISPIFSQRPGLDLQQWPSERVFYISQAPVRIYGIPACQNTPATFLEQPVETTLNARCLVLQLVSIIETVIHKLVLMISISHRYNDLLQALKLSYYPKDRMTIPRLDSKIGPLCLYKIGESHLRGPGN